jgi:rhomboid protease GluP
VLTATGLPHELLAAADGWHLLVPQELAGLALGQLRRWELENAGGSALPALHRRSSGRDGAACFALALIAVWLAQSGGHLGLGEPAGVADAASIRAGELWRALTALTLHADPGHLGSNLVFGALLVGALCWLVGTGAGLLLALLGGGLGNLAAALLRGHGSSIGASTAVFAVLGALGALAWRRRALLPSGRWGRAAPLLAALLLLGYLGLEGERVDVPGHALGFLAGLLLGAALGAGGALRPGAALSGWLDRSAVQWGAGLLAAGLLAAAWSRALA